MNKKELIEEMAMASGLTETQIRRCLDAMLGTIRSKLKMKEKIQIAGFGTFETVKRASRMGRNPKTGTLMQVPARYAPRFKAGMTLKNAVESHGMNPPVQEPE